MLLSMPKAKDRRRGQEAPICLVPELCVITGIDDKTRADSKIMKDLAIHTRVTPAQRIVRLKEFMESITSNRESMELLRDWKIKFGTNLVSINSRVLKPVNIYQSLNRNIRLEYDHKYEWTRSMYDSKLFSFPKQEDWVIITTQRDRRCTETLLDALMKISKKMGSELSMPRNKILDNDNITSFLDAIKTSVHEGTSIVVIVVPTNRKDRYDAIKRRCCIEIPVPSQVVMSRTLSRSDRIMSVAAKIMIQMTCKNGGAPWYTFNPISELMVIGADTYHDSSKRGRSVGAFVATMNETLTKYYCISSFQTSHEELQNNLHRFMVEALKSYYRCNGSLPKTIIIYRDGVGDGQLDAVFRHEVSQIISSFTEVNFGNVGAYDPRLAIIVVKKKIGSRFMLRTKDGYTNPTPGTVIDSEVTHPKWYDFYLVSQYVYQGTVSPTHFNVIYDSTTLTPAKMQTMAFKLCHMYYNWSGTIRTPAPCQYAHKLAYLVGQSLHQNPSVSLSNRLYFL